MPDHGGQKSTKIATDTVVVGTVETRGDLVVEGRVEGRVRCGGAIRVAAGGACLADVDARRAEIHGEVLGHVTCHQAIAVTAGGRVVGDLRAPDVAIDGAATVGGRVDLLPPAPTDADARRLPVTTTANSVALRRPPPRPSLAPHGENEREPTPDFRPPSPRAPAGDATTDAGESPRIPRPPRPRGRVALATTATTS